MQSDPNLLSSNEVKQLLANVPQVEYIHRTTTNLCVKATPKAVPVYDDGRNVIISVHERYIAPVVRECKEKIDE